MLGNNDMDNEKFNSICQNIKKSHEVNNLATDFPFYCVQRKHTDYFKNKDSFEYYVWVSDEAVYADYDPALFDELSSLDRKEINDKSFEKYNELFDRIDEANQRELLKEQLSYQTESGNASIRYCSDYWKDESWHLTYESAQQWIDLYSPQYSHKNLRIYAHSLNNSSELRFIVNLLKENRLTLVETNS